MPSVLQTRDLLERVAHELGVAAAELGGLEDVCVTTSLDHESLQLFDQLGQTLRALECFLAAAAASANGEVEVSSALNLVLLEGLRGRLEGARLAAPAKAAEFW